jgi:hypothetical protein
MSAFTAEGLIKLWEEVTRLTPEQQALADALQKLIDEKMAGQATHLVVQVGHGDLAHHIARHLKPKLEIQESPWIPPTGDWFVFNAKSDNLERYWKREPGIAEGRVRFYDAR